MLAIEKVFGNASWINSLKREFFGKSVSSREKPLHGDLTKLVHHSSATASIRSQLLKTATMKKLHPSSDENNHNRQG
jgi:hypothetical protein